MLLDTASNRPKRGRGGRSGVVLPFRGSGIDPDRSRVTMCMIPTSTFDEDPDVDE